MATLMNMDAIPGPFITVVSVRDCQLDQNLTVITPPGADQDQLLNVQDHLRYPASRLSIVHEDIEEDDLLHPKDLNNNNNDCDGIQEEEETGTFCTGDNGKSGYVTVLALGNKQLMPAGSRRSVVNIGPADEDDQDERQLPQVVAILSKEDQKQGLQPLARQRTKSIVEICNDEGTEQLQETDYSAKMIDPGGGGTLEADPYLEPSADLDANNNNDLGPQETTKSNQASEHEHPKPDFVTEPVTIYKLPGERLGFGLRFDAPPNSSMDEKVNGLFIQSCSQDSPASRASASWGPLAEGDQILAIEQVPVCTLSKLDCIQLLKDAPLVIHLLVRHHSEVVSSEPAKPTSNKPEPMARPSVPVAPPRRTKATLSPQPSVVQFKLKPPLAFSDSDNHDALGPPETARIYTNALDSGRSSSNSLHNRAESFTSDETGSTRSTVVSRLSMMSLPNMSADPFRRHDYAPSSGGGGASLPYIEGIEDITSPIFDEVVDQLLLSHNNQQSQQALSPPPFFQDFKIPDRNNNSALSSTTPANSTLAAEHETLSAQIGQTGISRSSAETRINASLADDISKQPSETEDDIRKSSSNELQSPDVLIDDDKAVEAVIPPSAIAAAHQEPQETEMDDDHELALLAEQLGLGEEDEEEDEAESLRKFLLLEEKLRSIVDCLDNGVDHPEFPELSQASYPGLESQQNCDAKKPPVPLAAPAPTSEPKQSVCEKKFADVKIKLQLSKAELDPMEVKEDLPLSVAAVAPVTEVSSTSTSKPISATPKQKAKRTFTSALPVRVTKPSNSHSTVKKTKSDGATASSGEKASAAAPSIASPPPPPKETRKLKPPGFIANCSNKIKTARTTLSSQVKSFAAPTKKSVRRTVSESQIAVRSNSTLGKSMTELHRPVNSTQVAPADFPAASEKPEEPQVAKKPEQESRKILQPVPTPAIEDFSTDTERRDESSSSSALSAEISAESKRPVQGKTVDPNIVKVIAEPACNLEIANPNPPILSNVPSPHQAPEPSNDEPENCQQFVETEKRPEDQQVIIQGSDSSPEVMDSTHELYHHHHNFIPPTYSRLPPDGDEFPNNSWAEDSSTLAGSGFHGDLKDTSKMYRADLKLVGKERAPPPLPPKGPPAASADDQIPSSPPPPLPTSIPPALLPRTASTHMAAAPPAALTRRSSSVEDKLRTSPGYINPPPAPHPRTNEPSKKSVRDKIAMFSSRSNSVEEGPSSNTLYRTTPTPSSVSSTSSLPRPGAFSKSSENLLSNNSTLFSVAATTPSYTPPATADKWKSSLDIRKSSIESHQYNSYTPKTSECFSSSDRSQSLLDVGLAEPGYRSQFTTPSYGGSSAQLMEQRRRANLSKLRGLVIPADNSSKTKESSTSVVDLPAIISKKDSVKSKEPLKPFDYKPSANNKPYVSPGSTVSTDSESDWKLPVHQNVLPKYSPAFKRRSLTPYSPSSPLKSNLVAAPVTFNNGPTSYKMAPEPKSLDSLASPHSDSSFEFQDSKQQGNNLGDALSSSTPAPPMAIKRNSAKHNGDVHVPTLENTTTRATTKAKLEDSDNDSAVSSSRSSISHGLSPPNSPTPQESSSTTPDSERVPPSANDDNSDEAAWRVLKPQSVEAINRKNVLSSAKFSSGLGADGLARPRRSDDEEASYADAEAEDTESSCSELDVSSSRRRPSLTNRLVHHQVRRGSASNNNKRPDTTEEEDNNSDGPPERSSSHMAPSHSKQSSVDVNDLPQLTESPLQAIYDMEAQMAYINEICDSLPNRSDSSSRYYSRRDSETTVIERPVIKERSRSQDVIDAPSSTSAADRRARNRSSSGNESDFSSSVSVSSSHSSKNTEQYRSDSYSRTEPSYPTITEVTHSSESSTSSEEKWSQLERKYSKSLTSVNLLESISSPKVEPPTAPAASVMSKYSTSSSNNVGIEKAFDKMLEKTFGDIKPKATANMPKGRNDFRSLSEKWQQISTTGEAPAAPPAPTPSSKPMPGPKPPKPAESPITAAPSYRSLSSSSSSRDTPDFSPRKTSTPLSRPSSDISNDVLLLETPPPVVPRSSLPLKPSEVDDDAKSEASPAVSSSPAPAGTKRSVSVNDIRRAFEKAEIAVSNREESAAAAPKSSALSSANVKESIGYSSSTSSVPSAHFRVSSFDSTTSEDSSATTPASGIYGSVNSLVSSAARDPYGSITSLASSTSLISPQELQQLIDEANQSLEEAGTPSHEVCVIILHREYAGGSLGITLAGGADYETKEITVHKVLTGSIADRDGRVHRGDRVLSINGKSTKGLTHREALTLLKAPRTEVVLVVSRGRTGTNGFQTIDESSVTMDRINEGGAGGNVDEMEGSFQWGPLKAVILIKDGAGLGFSLDGGKGSIYGDKPLTVKKIFVGGPAEKNGELTVGDLIVSIQGVNMSSKSRTEAWNFMKKLTDGDVKLIVRSSTS